MAFFVYLTSTSLNTNFTRVTKVLKTTYSLETDDQNINYQENDF